MNFCLKFLLVVGKEMHTDVGVRKSVQVHRGKVLTMHCNGANDDDDDDDDDDDEMIMRRGRMAMVIVKVIFLI